MKNRQTTDSKVFESLEILGAAFPWDTVDLWIKREPNGEIGFTAYVRDNPQLGFGSIFGHGRTAKAAVQDVVNSSKSTNRDPEMQRAKVIRELEEKLAKLKSVEIGLPPYRPGYYLAAPMETENATNIESEVQP